MAEEQREMPVLRAVGVKKLYKQRGGHRIGGRKSMIHAVDGVDFEVNSGEVFGIIGESGCGKSTLGRLLVRLEEPTEGDIFFNGESSKALIKKDPKRFHRMVQAVFQNPFDTFTPNDTIAEIMMRPLRLHGIGKNDEERRAMCVKALENGGLMPAEDFLVRFPHELSGGQLQRISILRSMLLEPLNGLLKKADDDTDLADMLLHMKKQQSGLYAHTINVALFGQLLARWSGCTEAEMEEVMAAGLLHDIGFLELWKDGQEQTEFLQEYETERYEKHVVSGYNLIKKMNIDQRIKQAVLTHHERVNGSGFPLQVMGDNISWISRILAVADTYDALTMRQGDKAGISAFEAIKKMEDEGYNRLDANYLMTFLKRIAETMIQRNVILNDGRMGRVVMINKYKLSCPLVQVGDTFVDLAKQSRYYIQEILEE